MENPKPEMAMNLSSKTPEWRIIQYFRDLNNLASLLNYDEKVLEFMKQLQEVGYSKERIQEFQNMGGSGTRFERSIPRVPRNRGSMREYHRNLLRKR